MNHTLDDSHPAFIEIIVTGLVEKSSLIAAMSDLLNHPDYTQKHTLWDFRKASMGLSMEDLEEIAGVLKLFKPSNKDFSGRSALLVPSMMELSMAKVYISISRVLPFEYNAFKDKKEALAFLTT